MCVHLYREAAGAWLWACSETVLKPVLNDKSAVCNRARTNQQEINVSSHLSYINAVSHFLAVSLLISLSFPVFYSVPFLSLSVSLLCLCSMLLWKPQHLYFKDVFVSLLCIQMIRLAGRRMQLWRRVGWWERRWRVGLWSQVSSNQIVTRWWQLEEYTANSPNAGHMTLGLTLLPEQF